MTTPIVRPLVFAAWVLLTGISHAEIRSWDVLQSLQLLSQPLRHPDQLDPLLEAVGDARLVLLGEASHGTHEFYVLRDKLSRRLIREQGFSFIAVEGDWASLLPLDRYVRLRPGAPDSAREALLQIERWPRWVWANKEMEALGEWLRAFNRTRPAERRVGIHGIDLYAIWQSLDAVEAFYQRHLPDSAAQVRQQYRFLRRFSGDSRAYADHVRQTRRSAQSAVAWVASDLVTRYHRATPAQRELLFEALQHAKVVEAGERYLRNMVRPGPHAWNTRAGHFERSLVRLLDLYGPGSRAIIWAHNTHVGDARATDMARTGEVNVGQLLRERYGTDAAFITGMGTATGSVLAAQAWEGRRLIMETPLPRPDSLEAALLNAGDGNSLLIFDRAAPATATLRTVLPHRAIGVVYAPQRERWMNYVPTRLAERYDAFVFFPYTHALSPLHDE